MREAFELLCDHAGDEGRSEALFGGCLPWVREAVPPFLVGERFPEVYFEFPLVGKPRLDASVLYPRLTPGARIHSPAAGDCDALLDFVATAQRRCRVVSFGFELDTGVDDLSSAGVYFQPRSVPSLASSFCDLIGEHERGRQYVEAVERMPEGWPLSYFGLFRGRADFPMRLGGYLCGKERDACVDDPSRIADAFERIGFSDYADEMLSQVAEVMRVAPGFMDFQFDMFADGSLGDAFAVEVAFPERTVEAMRDSLAGGPAYRVMALLKAWGLSDGRDELVRDSVVRRRTGTYVLEYRPKWVKIRWRAGRLALAKCYCLLWAMPIPAS